ncbi:glycosyltransferase family 2 protein [Cellulomonas endophytica]|uniref:glycosyltransferase family 2 protein n=1 Tax=Cellulomonas endophytica TaxID=2494735 RepID=UPI0010116046|nr:glycosyltransferase family 2 protein [Cellulomonas endophytica]
MPAWNEQEALPGTLAEVFAHAGDVDVLVVDDGSDDDTASVAAAAGATVLRMPYNTGVGGAMRAGFKYAQRHGYGAAIQVDADGQHDPREIAVVLAGLHEADVVIGARFADKGAYAVRGPRRWAMQLLAGTMSRIGRTRLTDPTSGFRAANVAAIDLYARHYPAEYLGDTVESLVIAIRSGLRVQQVPVEMRPRQGGRPSHAPWKAAVYLVRAVFALGLALVRRWPAVPPHAPVVAAPEGVRP